MKEREETVGGKDEGIQRKRKRERKREKRSIEGERKRSTRAYTRARSLIDSEISTLSIMHPGLLNDPNRAEECQGEASSCSQGLRA